MTNPDRTAWANPRPARGATYSPPTTRPERVWPVDVAAIDEWNAANKRARDHYWLLTHCICGEPCEVGGRARWTCRHSKAVA